MNGRFVATALSLVFCCAAVPAMADSLSHLLLPILNLSAVKARDQALPNLWHAPRSGGLAVRWRHEDLLRSYIDGVKVADLGTSQQRVTVRIPLPGLTGQWLQVGTARSSQDLVFSSGDLDWAGGLATTRSWQQLSWDLARGRHRASATIAWGRQRGRDETNLHRFHRSAADSRMNRYFWDLQEPTIGDQVSYAWNSRTLDLGAGWVTRRSAQYRAGVQVRWRRVEPNAALDYVNRGSNHRLQGAREADLAQRLTGGRVAVSVDRLVSPAISLRAEVGYATRRFEFRVTQRDVPQSNTGVLLDIVELGQADAEQHGADVTLRATWTRDEGLLAEGYVGLGRSRIEASGVGSTPVLGFSLRTIPIAHRGTASLTGRLTSKVAGFDVQRAGRRSGIHLAGQVVRSEFRGPMQADAQMGLGLFVAPIDRVSAYRLDLYRVSAAPWLRLREVLEVEYEITQYTGSFGDLGEAVPNDDEGARSRGGRIHAITVRYLL